MLRLYQSNRLELLATRLAELITQTAEMPLQAECVVVQHPGMGRWLALEIARASGICANIRFPLPAAFIWETFSHFLPTLPSDNRFDPPRLVWRIFELLHRLPHDSRFMPLHDYLVGDDETRAFRLAERLAALFDRYQLYRPDWILCWEAGQSAVQGDGWQAELWRRLVSEHDIHWVRLQQQLYDYRGDAPHGLPERVFLIGLPTLSPGYLQIIQWLSQWMEIHLFLLNPCAEHWTEIVDPQEQARRELQADGQELYLEVGNPLLATLGRQGRDFFAAVNEFDPGSEECFVDPGDDSLLHRLQRQILRLESAEEGSKAPDESIALHACHSPMREVEVLYDQLLAVLEAEPGLTPADVLVMTPDIDSYAPLIEAVFSAPGDRPAIPYHLSDRSLLRGNRYAVAFLDLLQLPGSRFSVNRMLNLLEIPAIARRFGLDGDAVEQIGLWVEAANIRWGRDGSSKAAWGLPEDDRNTWNTGLERLLLGFALAADSDHLWRGIAPMNAVEGAQAAWLGGLLGFCDAVFELERRLSGSRRVTDWCDRLQALTEDFFAPDSSVEQPLQQVRDAIEQLRELTEVAAFQAEVSLPLLRHCLEQGLSRPALHGFLAGGVTVCALAPMRSLPFRVICLIGMNDGSFPREQPLLGFDLMRNEFRFGDRSRRADDRYLFLETLISARRRLLISYVGRSIKDNSPLPPSVLVDELRDYLEAQIGEAGIRRITRQHPLQPFGADYFCGREGVFSYSARQREAAVRAGLGREPERPLIGAPLPLWAEQPRRIDLDQLIDFFTNPARVFARQRLDLQLISGAALLEEREPFALHGYSETELERELVHTLQAGWSAQACFRQLDARGVLPHGNPGRRLFDRLYVAAETMRQRIRALGLSERLPALDFELDCGEVSLQGRLGDLYPQGLFDFGMDRFYPHQRLSLWLRYLVLCRLRPGDVQAAACWLAGPQRGDFGPVAEPLQRLQRLLACYRQGMNEPLPFYPGTSWAYAQSYLRRGDAAIARRAAEQKWLGNTWQGGDQAKPYQRLLYTAGLCREERFARLSLEVFGPLIEHQEEA